MKKQVLNIFTVIALGLAVVGCKKGAESVKEVAAKVEASTEAVVKYKVDAASSKVMWKANQLVGGHSGTINVSNGVVKAKGNTLVNGNFIIDVASIANTDLTDAGKKNYLEGHLKSPDFFNVAKFPNASFNITSVSGNKVTGDLTIKGIKKSISVPVKVSTANGMLSLTSDMFTIDRTEWDIKYNSGKVMDPAKLGDKLIKDDVEMTLNISAKKA